MPKHEAPLETLQTYIPVSSAQQVLNLLNQFKVHLTITRERKSVLGDYRHATTYKVHRISVNGNLNKYSFLITLVHELAHLVTFEKYKHTVAPHGKEWKILYAQLLHDFLRKDVFPDDILSALKSSLHNLPASSCSDESLMRVLRNYDTVPDGMVLVEQLTEGEMFTVADNTVFKKGKKLRKRHQCLEVRSGRLFLFSGIYEVKRLVQG